jgi:hypothetical protein
MADTDPISLVLSVRGEKAVRRFHGSLGAGVKDDVEPSELAFEHLARQQRLAMTVWCEWDSVVGKGTDAKPREGVALAVHWGPSPAVSRAG